MALARTRIVIGGVVRNRAWILPEYLSALAKIEYDNKEFLFLENDSTDGTPTILADFVIHNPPGEMQTHHTGVEHWDHGEYAREQYSNLANVRNRFIEAVLHTGADFLLSVDSDVIVPTDIATRLLETSLANPGRPAIVAAAISNIPNKPLDGTTPGNFLTEQNGIIAHPHAYPLADVLEVAVTGAVYLIPREVLTSGARYGPHSQGEDFPFCRMARTLGYTIKVDTGLVCEHRMTRG